MSLPPSTLDTDGSPDSVTVALGAAVEPVEHEVPVGATLGRFHVLEEVGRGGMGRVLRAYDPKLQREVALKLLRGDVLTDEGHVRLVREAQAMARLSHPNVVAVHDVEDGPHGVVLVMEYVDGTTLQRWLQTPRPWAEVLARFVEAGRGLAAAHAQGLLHRDFKPANVLVASDGRVKVTDFGLAKPTGAEPTGMRATLASASSSGVRGWPSTSGDGPRTPWPDLGDDTGLTGTVTRLGTVVGTPRYMAPEQHRGEALGAAADQYAFCVALWEALAGTGPFFSADERHAPRLLQRKQEGPGPWPAGSVVPRPVVEALRRGLAPDTAQRWPDMNALLDRLAAVLAPGRRRELIALALVGGLATGGLAWLSLARTTAEPPCSGARAQLGDAWDDARREQVRQAILATAAPYAPDVATYVGEALDRYAEDWITAHREACEATTVRGEQSATVMDLRMACLHRSQVRLRAATGVLAAADAAVVERAHELVRGLEPLVRCADVDALGSAVPPPEPAEAAAVDELRTRLAEVTASTVAGRYDDARARLDATAPAIEAQSYAPLHTELELARGSLAQASGEYEAAEAALRRALQLGTGQQQWSEVRSAALRLLYVVGYQLAQPDAALRYRELAEGLVALGDDPSARITLHNNLGVIAFSQGRFGEAEAEMRRAAGLAAELVGPDHLDTLRPRGNMALAQYRQGRLEPALAELERVAARHEEILGPDHPVTAESLANVALVLNAQGHHARAEVINRRVLDIRERALGPAHPDLATALNNLSTSLHGQGRYAEAAEQLRRGLALLERNLGPEHPLTLTTRGNLAVLLKAEGRLAEAESEYRRVLELQAKALGPEHPNLVGTHNNLANLLQAQGRHAEAEAEHRRTLALAEATGGAESIAAALSRHNLALALQSQGRLDEAEAEQRRALELRQRLLPSDAVDLAEARHRLADILLARGRASEARPLAEQAWRVLETGEGALERRAAAAFVLARVLVALGEDRERARALAHQAERSFTDAGPRGVEDAQEVRQWLRTAGERGAP